MPSALIWMSHWRPNNNSTAAEASRARSGVNARIWSGRMPPGPLPAKRVCTRAVTAPRPPASVTTTVANAVVPSSMIASCTTSVATTLRNPPVVE